MDVDESDEDDEDGPCNIDSNDHFVLPAHFEVLDEPPFDFSLANLKKQRLKLAIKWPYGDLWGWVIGTF